MIRKLQSRDDFARALEAAVDALEPVTVAQLAAEGVVLSPEQVPAQFRVSFGKTFHIDAALWMRPRNATELSRVVRAAEALRQTIKPIGSLCTWSPAARPDPGGIALLTDGLDGVHDPEWALLRMPEPATPTHEARDIAAVRDARHFIRVGAGSTLWALNEALASRNLGLKTLGGYGGERVGGALSTGTHGSSIYAGPICDYVQSIDVIWRGVKVRLEPTEGLTDPAAFAASPEHKGWLLWQNDEAFHTTRISYGTMGVAFSYLIEVAPIYYLEERRCPIALSLARDEIRAVLRGAPGHVFERAWSSEFYFNLYAKTPTPLATRVLRTLVPRPTTPTKPRNTLDDKVFRFLRALGIDPGRFFSRIFSWFPSFVPTALAFTIKQLDERYVHRADHVYNMGAINLVGTLVQETAVPAENFDAYLEDCFAIARTLFEEHRMSLTSPIGVRFVKPSSAPLAVQGLYWTDAQGTRHSATLWAMVNYTLTLGTPHSDTLMRAFAEVGLKHGGRAHPGKYCFDSHAQWAERCDLPEVLRLRAIADPHEIFLNTWNRELFALPSRA